MKDPVLTQSQLSRKPMSILSAYAGGIVEYENTAIAKRVTQTKELF